MQILEIEKTCQLCNKPFIAKRLNTQYCSGKCSSRAYKLRQRNSKINQVEKEVKPKVDVSKIKEVKHKEILTITETALYIGVSRPTIYAYLKNGEIKSMRLGNRTYIKRSDIDALFNYNYKLMTEPTNTKEEPKEITEFYTIAEIKEKFNLKESWIYKIIRENNIPKQLRGKLSYVSKSHIDKYFKKNLPKVDDSIQSWYTTKQIQEKYNMTMSAIYSFVYERNIPKKKDGRKTLYSQTHFDEARGNTEIIEQKYYTAIEIAEKFNITTDAVYSLISYHKLPKIKEGQNVKVLKSTIDKLLNTNK